MHHLPFNLTFWSCVRRYFLLPDTLNLDTLLVCAHEPLQGPLETFAITGCFSLFQRALDLYTFKRTLIRRVPSILRNFWLTRFVQTHTHITEYGSRSCPNVQGRGVPEAQAPLHTLKHGRVPSSMRIASRRKQAFLRMFAAPIVATNLRRPSTFCPPSLHSYALRPPTAYPSEVYTTTFRRRHIHLFISSM